MTKQQLTALGLAALLALSLTACGGNTDQPDTTDPDTTPDTSAADAADNATDAAQTDAAEDVSLTTFRDTLKSGDYLCGIAYLGSTVTGATIDSLLDKGGYWEQYPFLKDFPQSQTVTQEGNEVYSTTGPRSPSRPGPSTRTARRARPGRPSTRARACR
ncbi:hypothetical protein [Evtepia sp.]|uniref:hypothetical protein n=1 Tax=Evtepia sp. TaxID=2773933 RepID=UPI002E7856B3|nr:hypothetical protein [Evtepia sp.]MEE0256579.1 hypothetical protein [Evtepia sp.]